MKKTKHLVVVLIYLLSIQLLLSCENPTKTTKEQSKKVSKEKTHNPVVYFEIPVTNMDRAVKFHKNVFKFSFKKEIIDQNEMALFPFSDNKYGISGALAKGEIYKPTKNGVLIYFKTENINQTLKLAVDNGGQVLYPKTLNDGVGYVAEFEDSEGNRIGLFQPIIE
jgi:predicted enzyme related to lactoylglutathione lyase